LARADRRALESYLIRLMQYIIKWHVQPEHRSPSWATTIRTVRRQIVRLQCDTPNLNRQVIETMWDEALLDALDKAEGELNCCIPPVTLTWDEVFETDHYLLETLPNSSQKALFGKCRSWASGKPRLVYCAGQRESYGKDAEAAMALSLGKPVIFYCKQLPRSPRQNRLPAKLIARALLMRHEHLAGSPVEWLESAATAPRPNCGLHPPPEAFDRVKVIAAGGG
jgi:Domain of unknown function DUF29